MTSPVDPSTSAGSTSTSPTSAGTASEVSQLSNPQLFLQLLIAELQNQDPTNPMQPSTILQQTSELSSVEAMNQMSSQMDDTQAQGLIGQSVTANVSGSPITGTVSAINLSSTGEPTITLSGSSTPVSLSDITEVA